MSNYLSECTEHPTLGALQQVWQSSDAIPLELVHAQNWRMNFPDLDSDRCGKLAFQPSPSLVLRSSLAHQGVSSGQRRTLLVLS